MKTKVIIGTMITLFLLLLTNITLAVTGTAELKTDVTQVKKGETFIVTLSATSEEGINGIDTKYTYDTEKLELISENLVDSSKWSNIGTSPSITVISNSTQSIKKADIYSIKFKVKDSVTVGDKLTVETTGILLDTDAQADSEVTIPAQKIEIAVVEEAKPISDESTRQDSQINSEQSSNESGKTTNEPDKKEIKNTSANSNGANQLDSTTATKIIPKTGENALIFVAMFIVIIFSIIFYKKYIQSKDIH